MTGFIQEFGSRLIADGFAFSFGQHESVERSLAFRVSTYRRRNPVDLTVESLWLRDRALQCRIQSSEV